VKHDAHLEGLKLITNPSGLEAWREKLFNVNNPTVVTEPEYIVE